MAVSTERLVSGSELQEGDVIDLGLLGENKIGLMRRITFIGPTPLDLPNDRCARRWICVEDVSWPLLIGVGDVVKVVQYA